MAVLEAVAVVALVIVVVSATEAVAVEREEALEVSFPAGIDPLPFTYTDATYQVVHVAASVEVEAVAVAALATAVVAEADEEDPQDEEDVVLPEEVPEAAQELSL